MRECLTFLQRERAKGVIPERAGAQAVEKIENINFSKGHYAKGRDRCKMNMRVTVSVQSGDASLSLSRGVWRDPGGHSV